MSDQIAKAKSFADLHVKGDPIIIYNAWDGGSAKAIVAAGAKAIATGDHPVGYSHGYSDDDFDDFTYDKYFATISDIAKVIDVPFSVDISNGAGLTKTDLQTRIKNLLEIGIIGINFEDRLEDSSGIKSIDQQTELIQVIRAAADQYGVPLFINARTDLFAVAGENTDHADLLDEAIERAKAYETAGSTGFFTPGLMRVDLIKQLCERSPLPINIIRLPGAPSTAELKAAGVSRISYGPVVQMEMIDWLKDHAKEALNGNI